MLNEVSIEPRYAQTGTAGTTDLMIDRTETSLGSGTHLFADFKVGGISRFKIDRLGIVTLGTWQGTAIADTYISSASNWNTAYTDRNKWDGGSTGLIASTGRTSLGLVIGTDILAYRTFGTAANSNAADLVHASGTESISGLKTIIDEFNVNNTLIVAKNLGGYDLTSFGGSSLFGKLLIGNNYSNSLAEVDFMNSIGTDTFAVAGFRFTNVDWEGGTEDLLWLKGDTKSAVVNNLVTQAPTGSSISTVKIGSVDSMSATLTTTQALTVEINGSIYHIALVH